MLAKKTTRKPMSCKKMVVIVLTISLSVVIAVTAFRLYLANDAFVWHDAIHDFENYEEDFLNVAAYCKSYVEEKKEAQADAKIYFMYSGSALYYDGEKVGLPDEIGDSVKKIDAAFKKTSLFSISCQEDGVYFYTEEGWYNLVYSYNGTKPQNMSSIQKDKDNKVHMKKLDDNWYHFIVTSGA